MKVDCIKSKAGIQQQLKTRHQLHGFQWSMIQNRGLYSPIGKTSYHCEILSWDFFNRPEIWQAPRQQRCPDASQMSEQCDHFNIQSRGCETSRDLVVLTSNRIMKRGPGPSPVYDNGLWRVFGYGYSNETNPPKDTLWEVLNVFDMNRRLLIWIYIQFKASWWLLSLLQIFKIIIITIFH